MSRPTKLALYALAYGGSLACFCAVALADDNSPAPPSQVAEFAKNLKDVAFKDGRYRDKDGTPVAVVTPSGIVDWAKWQGYWRFNKSCQICHGADALGTSFAPALPKSLEIMEYAVFRGQVIRGTIDGPRDKYKMPGFEYDHEVMCYLDDIYTYINARSINMASEGKAGLPPGPPAGREDISPEAKKAAAECIGDK